MVLTNRQISVLSLTKEHLKRRVVSTSLQKASSGQKKFHTDSYHLAFTQLKGLKNIWNQNSENITQRLTKKMWLEEKHSSHNTFLAWNFKPYKWRLVSLSLFSGETQQACKIKGTNIFQGASSNKSLLVEPDLLQIFIFVFLCYC